MALAVGSPPELAIAAERPGGAAGQRQLMAYFPTGVTIVTSVDDHGRPAGMTCSSLTSVCLDPPTVMVSLRTASHTARQVLARLAFGIALLNGGAQDIARRFAAPVQERFAGLDWVSSPLGVPWLVDCVTAVADFQLRQHLHVGDHTLLFGVLRNLEVPGGAPLLYGLRSYQEWPLRD